MERARAHIGRAAEQHQTRFATRVAPGVRLPRDQPDGAKADMPPACTFGCDVKQGAVAGRWVRFDEEVHAATLSRSEEHTSELQSLMRISYAVFCLKKKNKYTTRE